MRRFVLSFALLAASCGGEKPTSIARHEGALSQSFALVASRNHVPRDLLVAIAATEGGLEMPAQREVDPDATIPVAGPLQLRHGKLNTLARGAELMGVSELELRADSDLALEAGARVLAELGRQTGANEDLTTWSAALEELSGYADAPHRREYVQRVFATLANGGVFAARDDEPIALAPHAIPTALLEKVALPKLDALSGPDFTGAEWIPTSCTNKCTPTRNGAAVQFVLIHDTEGGWDASVATLQNDPNKSCHYIIGTDGRLGQFVHETVTAWHAGNFHYNERSVGIEHVGYSTKPYTEKQYAKSATLVDYLTKKYSVAKDRAHIIGHDQVPNGTKISQSAAPCSDSPKTCEANINYGGAGHHTDPGVWEWCTYMPRFGGACKCNDAYESWNCSYDKTKAIRCVGGKVEVAVCDGPGACEVQPIGTPDICHKAPTPTPDAGTPDAPAADSGTVVVEEDTAPPVVVADTGSIQAAAAPVEETEMSGGCTTSPGAAGLGAAAALIATLAALRLARRS
jgi:N-acetyl-anhydromuramyl-L-alanine amidase AmpD